MDLLIAVLIGLLLVFFVLGLRSAIQAGQPPKARGKRPSHWCWHCKADTNHRTRHHQTWLMRQAQ